MRCSYAPIGPGGGSAGRSSKPATTPRGSEGFQRLDLGATLPGVPLYRAFGFHEVERFVVTMPDGATLEGVTMERPIDPL